MNEHVHPAFRDILTAITRNSVIGTPQDVEIARLRALLTTVNNVLTLLQDEVAALGCGAQRVAQNVRAEITKGG